MATNAFTHALPVTDGTIGLRVEIEDDTVRLVVIDGDGDFEPDWGRDVFGGLAIVDALAATRGVSDDGTNAVWAEMSRS